MTRSEIFAETRSFLATAFLGEHETPSPLTLDEARYNMHYWAEDGVEYPEGMTPSVLVEAWNDLCYNVYKTKEEPNMKKVQFEAGEGRHFTGAVNILRSPDGAIYAECPVPGGASADYGYLALKKAIAAKVSGPVSYWYDGQEQYLEPDADADCETYVEIEEEETTMKKSEVIAKKRAALRDKMRDCYRSVLNSDGQIQYKIFIWSDGVIETLEGCQGDSSWLQAPDYETRELYEVCKIDAPCFDPWDYADHSAPEDEEERNAERESIISWLVGEYDPDEILDAVISDAQFDEEDDEEF